MQHDDRVPNPPLGLLGTTIVEEALQRALVWLPAEVTAYFPPTGRQVGRPETPAQVSLQISLKRARAIEHEDDLLEGETLERGQELDPREGTPRADRFGGLLAVSNYAPIPRAVVFRPAVGATCKLRGPVPIGTRGVALISSRMLDQWHARQGVVDPLWPATGAHLHNLASCVFLPGIEPGPLEEVDLAGAEAVLGTVGSENQAMVLWLGGGRMAVEANTELMLGSNGATLGVARLQDDVAPDATWATFATQVAGYINGLIPGTVTPPNPAKVGSISSASAKVKSE